MGAGPMTGGCRQSLPPYMPDAYMWALDSPRFQDSDPAFFREVRRAAVVPAKAQRVFTAQ